MSRKSKAIYKSVHRSGNSFSSRSSPADSKTDGIMRGTQQYQLNQQQHCHCEWHPFEQGGSGLALHFQAPIPLDGSSVEFAFCVPFSQADLETYLARLERQFRAYDRTVFTEKTGGNKETPGKKSSAGATSTARETRKVVQKIFDMTLAEPIL